MGDKYIIGKVVFSNEKLEPELYLDEDPYIETLECIANYPDPDFPFETAEEAAKHYYEIICELRKAAREVLS